MLVLSRKVGERILIGDQIAVTIVRVTGGGVRVGIEAPPEMAVLRAEIKAAIEGNSAEPNTVPFPTASQRTATPENSDATKVKSSEATETSIDAEAATVRKPR